MKNKLIIMRGLPFSGKSYRAKELAGENGLIFSTDEYFYLIENANLPNIYSFNSNKLGQAHQWNKDRCCDAMKNNTSLIIIDNTNVRKSEANFYIHQGLANNYEITIEEPTSPHWLEMRPLFADKGGNQEKLKEWAAFLAEGSRKSHNVPQEIIERMIWRWQEFDL